MKKLGKFQIAVLKRNMQNVKPFEKRIERLKKIVADAQAEIEANKAQVERYEAIAKEMTDGMTGAEYLAAVSNPEAETVPEITRRPTSDNVSITTED